MNKDVTTLSALHLGMGFAISQALTIIQNRAMTLMAEKGIDKEDIRIWMSPAIMSAVKSECRDKNIKLPLKDLSGIKILYGYEPNTLVVSHIQAELFDHEPTTVVVKIL